MSDLDLIKETYASMPDEKLIQLAGEDLSEMAPGAYEILKEEFGRRGLNINDQLHDEKKEEFTEETNPESVYETDKPEPALITMSYKDRMIIRATWFMFLFSILLGIGLLLILDNMIRKGGEEKPVFAIVTIFIGLVGFVAVLVRKRVYKKKETRFDFEKEKEKTDEEIKT